MAEHADSLRDLRFAVELRGQFEGLAKVAPRQRTSRNVLASLQRRRWLVAATVSLCVVGAMYGLRLPWRPISAHPACRHSPVERPQLPVRAVWQAPAPRARRRGLPLRLKGWQ